MIWGVLSTVLDLNIVRVGSDSERIAEIDGTTTSLKGHPEGILGDHRIKKKRLHRMLWPGHFYQDRE